MREMRGLPMTYLVNSVFHTLQGEGYWTGRAAVFCRLSRCNLWSGREEDRATAICRFCDTDFTAATRMTREELVTAITDAWPGGGNPMVVFTGGEPTLQLDSDLLDALPGFYKAIETNGTRRVPNGLDWVCVSPKAGTTVVQDHGDELKVVFPQDMDPEWWVENTAFQHHWLSPMDGPNLAENNAMAVDYCLTHPWWRLNIQTHKTIGIP